MRVVVIGAGYVGCVAATCLAKSGHTVWNVEIDAARLASLRRGKAPFYEPGLDKLVKEGIEYTLTTAARETKGVLAQTTLSEKNRQETTQE